MKDESEGIWNPLFLLGSLVGAAFTAVVGIVLSSSQNFQIIQDYQTLIGALIALTGALITVRAIRQQIKQTRLISEEERKRRHDASRALLPASLSELCEYSKACINLLLYLLPQGRIEYSRPVETPESELPQQPSIPVDAISVLRDCIESADSEAASYMADLAEKLQIQNSRFRSGLSALDMNSAVRERDTIPVLTVSSVERMIIDALEIYAHASTFFNYARRKTSTPPALVTLKEMTSAALNCNVSDLAYPGIYSEIKIAFEGGRSEN